MKLLLDTHILLWAAGSPERLSEEAYTLLSDQQNELFFSAASIWEIVIKSGLGRDDFQVDVRVLRRGLVDNGYYELPTKFHHASLLSQSSCPMDSYCLFVYQLFNFIQHSFSKNGINPSLVAFALGFQPF